MKRRTSSVFPALAAPVAPALSVPAHLDPGRVAEEWLTLLADLAGAEAAALCVRDAEARYAVLATLRLDEATILEQPALVSFLEAGLERGTAEGSWTVFESLGAFGGAPAEGLALPLMTRLRDGRWGGLRDGSQPLAGVVALLRSPGAGIDPDLAMLARLARPCRDQLAAALLLHERSHDPETKLPDRRELLAELDARCKSGTSAGRSGHPGGLILLARSGPLEGQPARVRALRRRLARLRNDAGLYRVSRATFAILVPRADRARLRELARGIADHFAEAGETRRWSMVCCDPPERGAEARTVLAEGLARLAGRPPGDSPGFSDGPAPLVVTSALWLDSEDSWRGPALDAILHRIRGKDPTGETLQAAILALGARQGALLRRNRQEDRLTLALLATGEELPDLPFRAELVERSRLQPGPVTEENSEGEPERVLAFSGASGEAREWTFYLEDYQPESLDGGTIALLAELLRRLGGELELRRLREKAEADRRELRELRAQVTELESKSTGALVPIERRAIDQERGPKIIGRAPAMARVLRMLDRVTDSDVPVLVQGETGTGKELVAQSLHERGPRRDGPFVTVNCSAISQSLMESELFGHERGSFTGATENKIGYFEKADGGTVFLDEVQDMSPLMQRELLRVIQDKEILRVGGKRVIKVDIRILAATNQDLRRLVEEDRFRQDLFYRLNVVTVELPPLRKRREDIPELVQRFIGDIAERYGLERPRLEQEALERILEYEWPGNIRELYNLLEKTVLLLDHGVIRAADVESDMVMQLGSNRAEGYFDLPYKDAKERFLCEYLRSCLIRHGGNVTRASDDAGLVRSSFHKMMRKHGLQARDYNREM